MRIRIRPRAALGALTALNVLNYLDRYVAAAVLPLILSGLSLTDSRGGMLQTSMIASFTVVAPLAGYLGSRYPRFPLAAAAALLWSAATFASGLAGSFVGLLLARALVGVGEATYTVVTPSLVADYYPPHRRARALAVFYAAIPVGSALGYQFGGWAGATMGYQRAFFLAGVPGLLIAIVFLFLRDPVRGGMDGPSQAVQRLEPWWSSLRTLARKRGFVVNTVAQTLYTFAMGGLAFWMPTFYMRSRGVPLKDAAMGFGAILVVAGFLGTLLGGQLGDRLAARSRSAHFGLSGVGLLASMPFAVIAVVAPSPTLYWPALFVALFLVFLNTGPLNAAMANALPSTLRERGFGVNTFCIHALGDALSPLLIGAASDRVGLTLPVLVTTLFLGVAGLVLVAGRGALVRDLEDAGQTRG